MKILELVKDVFGKTPDTESVKEFFQKQRKIESSKKNADDDTDYEFFNLIIHYLGGRSYNEFLDYSLLAIKLAYIGEKHCHWVHDTWEEMKEAIDDLLADDRHDLWQNLPCILDRITEIMKEYPKEWNEKAFWADIVDAVIDCINVQGTGDVSFNFKVPE